MQPTDPGEILTDAQLACVRMVGAGSSKIIAKRLGLSPHTVDNHLKAAMRRLGVHSRHEAAAILARWDEAAADQDLVSQSQELAPNGSAAMVASAMPPPADPPAENSAGGLRENPGEGNAEGVLASSADDERGSRNGRSPIQTAALIAAIVAAIAVTASAALPISQGFQALANLLSPPRAR